MITLKSTLWLIFSFLMILKTIAATDTFNNNATAASPSTLPSPENTTSTSENEDNVIFACGANTTVCKCDLKDLSCGDYSNPIKSLNIKLVKPTNYNLKTVYIKAETDVLRKDKLLPENEHSIEKLYFSISKIGSIEDGAFDKFIKLQSFSSVGKALSSLDLHHDGFVKLELDAFKYLTNLTCLNLGRNNMEAFLSAGMFPASLKELNMEFCKLSKLPDDIFSNLKSLVTLTLTGNPLTTIPKAINPLQKLNLLKLDYTKIIEIHFGEIQTLGNLTTLDLSNIDVMEYIDSFAFCSFPNLTSLDLSYNRKLSVIHENAFGSFIGHFVTKLQDFTIKYCNLTVLPENLLQWGNVKSAFINGNPFTCNCSMAWLINDFINSKPKYYKTFRGELPRCFSPSEFEGQTFQEISGTICFESNIPIDNRIVVCHENETSDSDSACKCSEHELSCKAFAFTGPTFLSLNLKLKDANYTLKKISFAYY